VLIVLEPGVSPIGVGHIFALLGAFGAACAFVIVRKIGQAERTVVMMVYPVLANLVGMSFMLPFVYRPMQLGHLGVAGLMSVLGFMAMLAVLAAYRRASAVVVAPMQYSQILWALAFSALLFDESLDRNVALGSAVIIASGIFIFWRENQLRR
jgi:S-adenosylmethionine uptake transporter